MLPDIIPSSLLKIFYQTLLFSCCIVTWTMICLMYTGEPHLWFVHHKTLCKAISSFLSSISLPSVHFQYLTYHSCFMNYSILTPLVYVHGISVLYSSLLFVMVLTGNLDLYFPVRVMLTCTVPASNPLGHVSWKKLIFIITVIVSHPFSDHLTCHCSKI